MADASLDDFFAKKDKSKKKSKSKLTPSDISSEADDGPKKTKKKKEKKKEKEAKETEKKSVITEKKDEEEWEDFEQEQEKDYSGLRIGTLQISKEEGEKEKEEEDGTDEEDNGEEGQERQERKEKRDKGSDGPWNKGSSTHEHKPAQELKKDDHVPPNTSGGKYIPPSRRGLGADFTRSKRAQKVAPNIKSEMDFPTLGGGPGGSEGQGKFEEVRFTSHRVEGPTKRMQQLELGNKFGALQND